MMPCRDRTAREKEILRLCDRLGRMSIVAVGIESTCRRMRMAPQLALSYPAGNCCASDSLHLLDSLADILGDFKHFNRCANRLADALAQGDHQRFQRIGFPIVT